MKSNKSSVELEIIEAERAHEVIASGFAHLPTGEMILTRDFDSVVYLEGVMKTVESLLGKV